MPKSPHFLFWGTYGAVLKFFCPVEGMPQLWAAPARGGKSPRIFIPTTGCTGPPLRPDTNTLPAAHSPGCTALTTECTTTVQTAAHHITTPHFNRPHLGFYMYTATSTKCIEVLFCLSFPTASSHIDFHSFLWQRTWASAGREKKWLRVGCGVFQEELRIFKIIKW